LFQVDLEFPANDSTEELNGNPKELLNNKKPLCLRGLLATGVD
jgi:hypothetical protein